MIYPTVTIRLSLATVTPGSGPGTTNALTPLLQCSALVFMKISMQVSRDGEPLELTMDTPRVRHVAEVAEMGGGNNVKVMSHLVSVCNGQLNGKDMNPEDFLDLDFSAISRVEKALEPFLGGSA